MNECWYAFALALVSHVYLTPERAFGCLASGKKPRKREPNTYLTDDDVADMSRMKEDKLTYRQIGEMYGLDRFAIYNRIRRCKGII